MTVVLNEAAIAALLQSPTGPVAAKVLDIASGVQEAYKKRGEEVSARAPFTPLTFQSGFQNGLEIEVGFVYEDGRIEQKILREEEKLLPLIQAAVNGS